MRDGGKEYMGKGVSKVRAALTPGRWQCVCMCLLPTLADVLCSCCTSPFSKVC